MLGAIELTDLTGDLIPQIESVITLALPIIAVIISVIMMLKIIRRLLGIDGDFDAYGDYESNYYSEWDDEPYYGDGSNSFGEVLENTEENYEHYEVDYEAGYGGDYDGWLEGYQRD